MNIFQNFQNELSHIDIDNPEFDNTSKVHNWRNYIPPDWKSNWKNFTESERKIMIIMAQIQADNENWD